MQNTEISDSTAKAVLKMAKLYFAKEENRKAFEEWKVKNQKTMQMTESVRR